MGLTALRGAAQGQLAAGLLVFSAQTDLTNGRLQAGVTGELAAMGAGPPGLNPGARLHLGAHHRRPPQLHPLSAAC